MGKYWLVGLTTTVCVCVCVLPNKKAIKRKRKKIRESEKKNREKSIQLTDVFPTSLHTTTIAETVCISYIGKTAPKGQRTFDGKFVFPTIYLLSKKFNCQIVRNFSDCLCISSSCPVLFCHYYLNIQQMILFH